MLFALVISLVFAQTGLFTPIDPIRGVAQSSPALLDWVVGDYGTATTSLIGNHTTLGKTLLLNDINSPQPALANWSLTFDVSYDLTDKNVTTTLWIPASMASASISTPLVAVVNGHPLTFQPTHATNVSYYPLPVYVPAPSATSHLPAPYAGFSGNYLYVPLSFTSVGISSTILISLTVPAHFQDYIPNVIVTVQPSASAASSTSARWTGLAMLPLLAAAVGLGLWLIRRWTTPSISKLLAVGVSARLLIAPFFLHTDLVTLSQYPRLFYDYSIVNLQSFIYGPVWYASLVVVPSPLYAGGLSPSVESLNLLFKLTPIAFDGLTYLALYRLLKGSLEERLALRWATLGWLFNPIVVYFSAVHGLAESVIAFFVVMAILLFRQGRHLWTAVSAGLAVLTLYPALFGVLAISSARRLKLSSRLALLLFPFVVMAGLFLAVYHATVPIESYIQSVVATTNPTALQLYGSPASVQSPWFLPYRSANLYPSPVWGLVVAAVLFIAAIIFFGGVSEKLVPLSVFVAFFIFYLSIQNFSAQFLIWTLPVFVYLVSMQTARFDRGLTIVWGASALGLVCLYMNLNPWTYRSPSWNTYLANADPYIAMVLFAVLASPLVVWLSPALGKVRWPIADSWRLVVLLSSAGLALGLAISTSPDRWIAVLPAGISVTSLLSALTHHGHLRVESVPGRGQIGLIAIAIGSLLSLYLVITAFAVGWGASVDVLAWIVALAGLLTIPWMLAQWLPVGNA